MPEGAAPHWSVKVKVVNDIAGIRRSWSVPVFGNFDSEWAAQAAAAAKFDFIRRHAAASKIRCRMPEKRRLIWGATFIDRAHRTEERRQ